MSDEQAQRQTHREMDAERGLHLLKVELENMPDNMKTSFAHAQHVAPDLVCDRHLSRFLYAEEYNVKVSCELLESNMLWTRPLSSSICASTNTQPPKISSQQEGLLLIGNIAKKCSGRITYCR